jgi:undecaprenyl-diphosphatase
VGFATSLVVGYAALRLLLAFVQRGRLHWFASYCWAVGIIAIVWFSLK